MNRAHHAWSLVAAAAVLLGAALGGCVEDVGMVDRTDPNKIDKGLFEGVWIYSTTTIDSPYSTAVTFSGELNFGQASKIIFDLQENRLVAYPVVETVEGSEKGWKLRKIRKYWDQEHRDEFVEMYTGMPVASWQIDSHFDVIRDYNTYNGAQSNQLVENTTDRPWYERDYVRVDWHDQSIEQFFYALAGGVGHASYYVGEDKRHEPDAMLIDAEGGYFDYTVRTMAYSTGQSRCSIYGLSQYDCAAAEIRARHSFRRLDPKRDYEPIRYHNNEHMEKFGFFLTERYAYDSDWGPTYEGKVQLANRWNLWDHTYDFQRPLEVDGRELTIACFSDVDCDVDAGERCQKDTSWFGDGYCATPVALPYSARGLRPIIYHMNMDWHPDYLHEAYQAADGWSDVFKDAVAWALYHEAHGQMYTRSCESHDDCLTDAVVADVDAVVSSASPPCHADTDCTQGTCGDEGVCVMQRACSADLPCALGQECHAGLCTSGGTPVVVAIPTKTQRSSTLVYYGDGAIVTFDNFSDGTLKKLGDTPGNNAFVRFIHAAPDKGPVSLKIGQTTIPGGAFDATRDYDFQDPTQASFVAIVPAGSGLDFSVLGAEENLPSRKADLAKNASYVAVYTGEDLIITGSSVTDSLRGVRLIHAAPNAAKVDFGLTGARIAQDVAYKTATKYFYMAGDVQRAVVTRAGSRGDVTCYVEQSVGRCVGWPAAFTQEDRDEAMAIKASLPEMFVICENQFDPIAAGETIPAADRRAFLGNARYTYLKDGQPYNPCGDPKLVPHPEQPKRIGDIRYSFFNWINEAQRSGPLGYGPSIADPDTGQLIYGVANIYGASMHTYGQYAADLLELVNGDLDSEDVIVGQQIRDYLKSKEDATPKDYDTYQGALLTSARQVTEGPDLLQRLRAGCGHDHGADYDDLQDTLTTPSALMPPKLGGDLAFPELVEYMRYPDKLRHDLEQAFPPINSTYYADRLAKVNGTFIEDLMMNSEVMLAEPFVDPAGELDEDALRAKLTPSAWATKKAMRDEDQRVRTLMRQNLYMGEFIDDSLYGTALELKEMGLWGDSLRLEMSRRMLGEVLEHEIGHTIGLRHNFSGSTDVFNFMDDYYTIREAEMMLCQTDEWCDTIGGEVCGFNDKCASDSDCIPGLYCIGTECQAPAVSDPNSLVPTGICSLPVGDKTCTQHTECGDGNLCLDGKCLQPHKQFVPRSWMTDKERAEGRTEYQYSTVMDYGQKVNHGMVGMGKWDYAAIRFGYTQLVDTYADQTPLRDRVERAAKLYAAPTVTQYSFFLETAYWPTRGTGFWHAFNYLNNYIGVENNLNRVPMPYDQVKYQKQMAYNDVREYWDYAYIEVPYAFCSDEYRGNMGCYYFDQGIDAGEMAQNAYDQLEQYYIFDAFKRERLYYGAGGDPMSYYGRIMDRYLTVLGDVGMYAAMWDSFLFRYGWYYEWRESPLGGLTLWRAANETLGKLFDIISSPAPGSYALVDPDAAVAGDEYYTNISLTAGAPGSDFDIPFGLGRYPYTQFGESLGYTYWENPLWFGSFWEKLGALITLTDSTAYFVDTYVGEQDVGMGTSLGYNTLFADALGNYLGGIVTGEMSLYAGRVVQGKYYGPSVPGRAPQDVPVEPGLNNFTLKLYSAVLGLANLPAGFDPSFIDRMAVYLEGEANQFDHEAAGVVAHRFEDPLGGKVYIAYTTNYAAYGAQKMDAAVTLVDRAQGLADQWQGSTGAEREAIEAQLNEVRELLDVLRGLNQIYGTSVLGF